MKVIIRMLVIIAFTVSFVGCKKHRFEKFGNEIRVTNIPEFCNPCYLTLSNESDNDQYNQIYHTYYDDEGHYRFYIFDGNSNETVKVFIDWKSAGLTDPNKENIRLRLVQIKGDDQMPWVDDYNHKETEQIVEFKPRKIYNWNVGDKSFEDTGEKTDKIIRSKSSNSDEDTSSPTNGGGCGNLDYNGPTNDVQLKSWCKMAQAYKCSGNESGRKIVCNNIKEFCNNCECPYCP